MWGRRWGFQWESECGANVRNGSKPVIRPTHQSRGCDGIFHFPDELNCTTLCYTILLPQDAKIERTYGLSVAEFYRLHLPHSPPLSMLQELERRRWLGGWARNHRVRAEGDRAKRGQSHPVRHPAIQLSLAQQLKSLSVTKSSTNGHTGTAKRRSA